MTFICYAQNLEDIILWRALRFFPNGFYIDIGANDPTIESVTKAFYERGWSGINIEPSPKYYARLCAERSRDINLPVAVSDREGELIFYDAGESGRSTVEAVVASNLDNTGVRLSRRKIATRTLSAICPQHVSGEIHFLKIDVEGHEQAVLSGMDFQTWRPWIVVIENPFNVEPAWAPLLETANYKYAHYDGLNRYYVALEHIDLAGAFATPPSFLDDFRLCYGHAYSHPVAELEAQIAYERNRADAATAKLAAMERPLGWMIVWTMGRVWRALKKIAAKMQ